MGDYATKQNADAYLDMVLKGRVQVMYAEPTPPDLSKPYSTEAPEYDRQQRRRKHSFGAQRKKVPK